MTTIIVTIAVLIGLMGISTVVWSYIDTRNKSYEEYVLRKRSK